MEELLVRIRAWLAGWNDDSISTPTLSLEARRVIRDRLTTVERLHAENEEMARIVHDRREDASTWIEQGAGMERARLLKLVQEKRDEVRRTDAMLGGVSAAFAVPPGSQWTPGHIACDEMEKMLQEGGMILPHLPPDGLKRENDRLAKALVMCFKYVGKPTPQLRQEAGTVARNIAETVQEALGQERLNDWLHRLSKVKS